MPVVRRTDETVILNNHEARIAALERAPSGRVYVDKRILDAAADHVLFEDFPQDRTILELAWYALTDSGGLSYASLFFNGDATANDWVDEEEYRWNIGIPNPLSTFVSVHSNEEFGGAGWISPDDPSFGRVRFPAYSFAGGEWHGDVSVNNGNDTIPGVCSGARDDSGADFVLSALSMIAVNADTNDRQEFAAGSWFALTAY